MAHVAEECRLGTAPFGELFSAFSFLLIGIGVGNAGGDLAGDEIEKPFVEVIELPIGVERGNEDADRLVLPLPRNRSQARPRRWSVPASVRKIGKRFGEVFNGKAAVGTQNLADRPRGKRLGWVDDQRSSRMIGFKACSG